MFRVYLQNFRLTHSWHNSLDDAVAAGKETGFDFAILRENALIGYYTVFGGWVQVDSSCSYQVAV